MPLSTLAHLEAFLLDQQLVQPEQLQDARRQLGREVTYDGLVKALEQKTYLTSYQSQKLLKRDTEGLRLGRYKLLYRNAAGSFARVFRACSVDDGQTVALKVLRNRHVADARSIALFRREGELGRRLRHKNIVPIYEVASDGDQHYITMEFVEGGNFRDFLKIRKKFAVPEATRYVLDIAEGLEYALSLGLTHRDLRMSNVLLSAQGVAKLVDFGLAGQESPGSADDVDRAIEYATLEKGSGAPDNDPRSDLYFLGAMYYELLTGVPPYAPTRNSDERKQFSRYRDVRPIREIDPSLPRDVVEIVDRLMTVRYHDRYQNPSDVVRDLKSALGEGAAESSTPVLATSTANKQPTLICLETRNKAQDALREYFSRHGFRVLVLTDPLRALQRIETDDISGLVLIGDALESNIPGTFQAAVARCRKRSTAVVLTLSTKHSDLIEKCRSGSGAVVLSERVTLRAIREALIELTGVDPSSVGKDPVDSPVAS